MKILLIMNLMIYAWHYRCKSFSQKTWSKFVSFDFFKNIYALHYEMARVLNSALGSIWSCLPIIFCKWQKIFKMSNMHIFMYKIPKYFNMCKKQVGRQIFDISRILSFVFFIDERLLFHLSWKFARIFEH